jgi:succinyl-CoA synthetase alpha subunit
MIEQLLYLDSGTRVLVQGITGRMGRAHARLMKQYGTSIVAGTGTRTEAVENVPVFSACKDAIKASGATVSIAMVGPNDVLAAATEAIDAGIKAIVTIAEGMPVHDALRLKAYAKDRQVAWLGPSTPGIAVPNKAKVGFLPDIALHPGRFALLSKSGTLSYEVAYRLKKRGLGQSVWVGVGGDAVKGIRFSDLVAPLMDHAGTEAIILVGEIGGSEEEEFAQALVRVRRPQPVFALIAGREAKEGVSMGHAGAIIHGTVGTLDSKVKSLKGAGADVCKSIGELIERCNEAGR